MRSWKFGPLLFWSHPKTVLIESALIVVETSWDFFLEALSHPSQRSDTFLAKCSELNFYVKVMVMTFDLKFIGQPRVLNQLKLLLGKKKCKAKRPTWTSSKTSRTMWTTFMYLCWLSGNILLCAERNWHPPMGWMHPAGTQEVSFSSFVGLIWNFLLHIT